MATVPLLFADFNLPDHPDAPGRLSILLRIALLNTVFAALSGVAFLIGLKLSGRSRTLLFCVVASVGTYLLLRVFAFVPLEMQIPPATINLLSIGVGLLVALANWT